MKSSDRFFVDGIACVYDGVPSPVANLSVGGFFVASERPPMKGQVLDLELRLGTRRRFHVLGTVTWVNDGTIPSGAHQPPGFGVRITRIDLGDKVALIDLLRRAEEGSAPGRPSRS